MAIPVLASLPAGVTEDQLRGLGAAAASAGKVTMFHAVGITPEAPTIAAGLHDEPPERELTVEGHDLRRARRELSSAPVSNPAAVCLGTPHFSLDEFGQLLGALAGRRVSKATRLVGSTRRHNQAELLRKGMVAPLRAAGVELVADTCTDAARIRPPARCRIAGERIWIG